MLEINKRVGLPYPFIVPIVSTHTDISTLVLLLVHHRHTRLPDTSQVVL